MSKETKVWYGFSTIVLRNSSDEITFAEVSCMTLDESINARKLRDKISNVIEEWRKETEAGEDAWEYTCEDFNIGDLASRWPDEDINNRLEKAGIKDLHIETHSFDAYQPTPWSYDDILGK